MGTKSKAGKYVHIFKDKKTGVEKRKTKKRGGSFGSSK